MPPVSSPAGSSGEKTTPHVLNPTAERVAALAGEKNHTPTTQELPAAPRGFSDAEVKALADRAVDLVTRGVAPGLSKMSPSSAFDYVFANQYPATTASSRRATKDAAGRYDWEWGWASRFADEPSIPARFLESRWEIETEATPLGNGRSRTVLRVSLSVAVQHLIPDTANDRQATGSDSAEEPLMRPIVIQRTVIVQGFKPLGGPKWWPGVGLQARPFFGGQCAPVNGSILTPATRPKTLERDFERLAEYLDDPVNVDENTVSDAGDLSELVDKYCEE